MSPIFVLCFTALIALAPTSGRDNKVHEKNPSKPLLKLPEEFFRGKRPKTSAEPLSFSQRLFNDEDIQSPTIREKTIESDFIQGMASGTLNANYYGAYMVQDLAYLYNAVNAFNNAAEVTGQSDFEQFYRNKSSEWDSDYLVPMLEDWHLVNTENVQPSTEAREYMSFLITVSQEKPEYLAIAMLPCTMLWRWMADELYDSVPQGSAYYHWFEENKSPEPGYQGSLEIFVDEHFTTEQEYEEAKPIFCQAMVGECDFFHEGGGQSRCELPAECSLTG